jgi:ketosteroid isomerase-like protein
VSAADLERAKAGYAAVLRGDLEALAELLHADVRWHGGDPDATGACRSRGEALEFIRRARERGGLGELVELIDAGERLVAIIRPRHGGGDPSALTANVTTFRDGKVVEIVHYPNPDDALTAAGLPPRGPG